MAQVCVAGESACIAHPLGSVPLYGPLSAAGIGDGRYVVAFSGTDPLPYGPNELPQPAVFQRRTDAQESREDEDAPVSLVAGAFWMGGCMAGRTDGSWLLPGLSGPGSCYQSWCIGCASCTTHATARVHAFHSDGAPAGEASLTAHSSTCQVCSPCPNCGAGACSAEVQSYRSKVLSFPDGRSAVLDAISGLGAFTPV